MVSIPHAYFVADLDLWARSVACDGNGRAVGTEEMAVTV